MLKKSKQNLYQKYFEENKKNCKDFWNGIHDIIYSKKKTESNAPFSLIINEEIITNKKHMVEKRAIGKNIQDTKYPTKKDYSHYLKQSNPNIFFITPTSPKEIIDITQSLKRENKINFYTNASLIFVLTPLPTIL